MLADLRPFAIVERVSLELKLSQGNSEPPPAFQGALFDEEMQDPMKEIEAFPLRTPKEEVLAIEWEKLDILLMELPGLQEVDMQVDVIEKLTESEFEVVLATLQERMSQLHHTQMLKVAVLHVKKGSTGSGSSSHPSEKLEDRSLQEQTSRP
jgi:hypothetical protein